MSVPSIAFAQQKLLLTEAIVSPDAAEGVAIHNPNAVPVDLTNYYLADYNSYYTVTAASPTAPGSTDFLARFPAGASIAAGEKQYVSLRGAECFRSAPLECGAGPFLGFGVYPDYELPPIAGVTDNPNVPTMLAPFAGAIGATRGITNGGEPIILFYWDGATNLVTDIDYVVVGAPSAANATVNKTGVTINGSTYANDTPFVTGTGAPLPPAAPIGGTLNTCRSDPTEGTQIKMGAFNGFNGGDETSETWSMTWVACSTVFPAQEDTDADAIPNAGDNCPTTPNYSQTDADSDADGDACDNCPLVSNADQADGDADLIGNVCDNCATTANTTQVDADADSVGDVCDNCPGTANTMQTDTDTDTVGDACDNCATTANTTQVNSDTDGAGDECDNCDVVDNADQADGDTDAVGDACDSCPAEAGDPANQGCPEMGGGGMGGGMGGDAAGGAGGDGGAPSTGGAGGDGGSPSTGGSGGEPSEGGAASGGSPSTGGSPSDGGSPSNGGSGGEAPNTGGTGGGGTDSGVEGGGCDCTVAGTRQDDSLLRMAGLLGLLAVASRRRKR